MGARPGLIKVSLKSQWTTRRAAFSSPAEQLAAIPEFQGLGPLFKSSEPVQLTEAETEYVVRCIKHTFAGHMVFQFDCTNTLNDQLLQKVAAATLCASRPPPSDPTDPLR